MPAARRVGVLTVSDRSHLALREDASGPAIVERVRAWGWEVPVFETIPDEAPEISALLTAWADEQEVDLILTTGGTGLGPRDVTPEATRAVAERIVPGISEWLRAAAGANNPHAFLSRAAAVLRGRTLIVNLPGSPRAVRECLDLLELILPHALDEVSRHGDWDRPTPHPRFAGPDRARRNRQDPSEKS
jgi:molybdopterin adenylyltransferase